MKKNKHWMLEIWTFMKENKAWWLTPIIIVLILAGILILVGQSNPVTPFVYIMF